MELKGLPERLSRVKELEIIGQLHEKNLEYVCRNAVEVNLSAGDVLEAKTEHRWLFFLLSGEVLLDGKPFDSEDIRSKKSLFSGGHHVAKAQTEALLLRVDREQIESLRAQQLAESTSVSETSANEDENVVFMAIHQAFSEGLLEVPSLPEVVLKVRDVLQDPEKGMPELAKVIQLDPPLTARLIQVANSPHYQGVSDASDLPQAINRLGLDAVRDLTNVFAIKQILNSDNTLVLEQLRAFYEEAASVASLSYVVADHLEGIHPEKALLAGLLLDIGAVPIVNYAGKHPELFNSRKKLMQCVANLRGVVGCWLLSEWGFDEELSDIPVTVRDWYRQATGEVSLDHVVSAALAAHGEVASSEFGTTPMFRAFLNSGLDLSDLHNFVQQAEDQVAEARALLG